MEVSVTTIHHGTGHHQPWMGCCEQYGVHRVDGFTSSTRRRLKDLHCGCKSGCSTNRCSCFKENLHCTVLCHCEGCANCSGSADEDSEADDYDISHEDDSESDNDYGDN